MNIFAKDYTSRILTGSEATLFFWINAALTIVPLAIVTWVLSATCGSDKIQIPLSNLSITISFVIIWGIALWMLNKEYNMRAYDITHRTASPESMLQRKHLKLESRTNYSDGHHAQGGADNSCRGF